MRPEAIDYVKTYEDFWKSIVENPDGSLNLDQVMRELGDYKALLGQASEVYSEVTGYRISKPNTMAFEVIAEAERHVDELIEEALKERDESAGQVVYG